MQCFKTNHDLWNKCIVFKWIKNNNVLIHFTCMFQMNFRVVSVLICNTPSIYINPILDHCNMGIVILPLPSCYISVDRWWLSFSTNDLCDSLTTVWYTYCLCGVIHLIKKEQQSLGIQPEPHYCTCTYSRRCRIPPPPPSMFAEITFMVTAQHSTP